MQTLHLTKKYDTYPEYKDSGVAWLDKIPKDWDVKRLKHNSKILNGATPDSKNSVFWDGDIAWVTPDDLSKMHGKYIHSTKRTITEDGYKSCGTTLIPSNNIILSTRAPIGLMAVNTKPVCTNQGCKGIILRNGSNTNFMYYQILSLVKELNNLGSGTTFKEISYHNLANIAVVLPSEALQKKIADYLDEKTIVIDEIIEKKQKQIELLREKRTAMITKAVTKGLDPKAELVESGIAWIGKIPEGWKVSSLKSLLKMKITDGPHTTPELFDDGVIFISAESIQENNTIDFNKMRGFINLKDHKEFSKKAAPQRNDIFMVKSGATTGRVAIVETDLNFSIWSPLALIRVNSDISAAKYLYYFLQADLFQDQVRFSWSFGTQQNIGMGVIENLKIIYPNVIIQKEIASFLDLNLLKIDTVLNEIENSINLLQEFKSSLISNVVTGKVKV